jgi:hypothetical protein
VDAKLASVILVLIAISGCTEIPHVRLRFSANKKGEILVTNFRVPERNLFNFDFDLYFNENDREDRIRIQKMAGSGISSPDRKRLDNGLPIPVKLKIITADSSGEHTVFEKEIYEEEFGGTASNYFLKVILEKWLDKGNYKIKIESLHDIPELENVVVDFDIHSPGNIK